ncbi:AAEL015471-PA [Aedes aegypti]|uniref:AAEL015471-PA n=1 Tax=Aedes aegypti TaxID=7159 RepID=Q1DGU9_AEDAE|nr:AAEL015471-PA [Aedes aegypti]
MDSDIDMTEEQVVQLIELVRKHPLLYDKQCHAYRKAALKDRAWSSIASILGEGITGEKAYKRWKNLRDRFMKELRKVENTSTSGAGVSDIHTPKWVFYEDLSFLRDHCKRRRTTSNYPSSTSCQKNIEDSGSECQQLSEDHVFDGTGEVGEVEYLDEALESLEPVELSESCGSRKKKRDSIDKKIENIVDNVGEVLATMSAKKGKFQPFCDSLAEKLERLPPHVARALETKYTAEINSLLDEYDE